MSAKKGKATAKAAPKPAASEVDVTKTPPPPPDRRSPEQVLRDELAGFLGDFFKLRPLSGGSRAPAVVLADFLVRCLDAFEQASAETSHFFSAARHPGPDELWGRHFPDVVPTVQPLPGLIHSRAASTPVPPEALIKRKPPEAWRVSVKPSGTVFVVRRGKTKRKPPGKASR